MLLVATALTFLETTGAFIMRQEPSQRTLLNLRHGVGNFRALHDLKG